MKPYAKTPMEQNKLQDPQFIDWLLQNPQLPSFDQLFSSVGKLPSSTPPSELNANRPGTLHQNSSSLPAISSLQPLLRIDKDPINDNDKALLLNLLNLSPKNLHRLLENCSNTVVGLVSNLSPGSKINPNNSHANAEEPTPLDLSFSVVGAQVQQRGASSDHTQSCFSSTEQKQQEKLSLKPLLPPLPPLSSVLSSTTQQQNPPLLSPLQQTEKTKPSINNTRISSNGHCANQLLLSHQSLEAEKSLRVLPNAPPLFSRPVSSCPSTPPLDLASSLYRQLLQQSPKIMVSSAAPTSVSSSIIKCNPNDVIFPLLPEGTDKRSGIIECLETFPQPLMMSIVASCTPPSINPAPKATTTTTTKSIIGKSVSLPDTERSMLLPAFKWSSLPPFHFCSSPSNDVGNNNNKKGQCYSNPPSYITTTPRPLPAPIASFLPAKKETNTDSKLFSNTKTNRIEPAQTPVNPFLVLGQNGAPSAAGKWPRKRRVPRPFSPSFCSMSLTRSPVFPSSRKHLTTSAAPTSSAFCSPSSILVRHQLRALLKNRS